jgi:anthranilate phosphoribosyltransferase
MKHSHPVRVDLKMRTVFNLLGPLTNPAGATAQIIGAPSLHTAELMAGAIMALGMHRGGSETFLEGRTRGAAPIDSGPQRTRRSQPSGKNVTKNFSLAWSLW